MRKPIPTNIVTGFLGTGKTTAILDLLMRKPVAEKWAVLVNEFGEIGIDGAILAGSGAEIREIAGGCMCCVADLPMKIALNNLIVRTAPDRLLIEPSGLGHPQEIVDTLRGEYYRDVLDLRAVIALMDPRKLGDSRYITNQTFNAQLRIADVVVANKTDLCAAQDNENFQRYIEQLPQSERHIGWISRGQLDLDWLDLPHRQQRIKPIALARKNNLLELPAQGPLPIVLKTGEEFVRRENRRDGYYSCGWQFSEQTCFKFQHLMLLFSGVMVDRLKAVLKTDAGCYVFNAENGVLSVNEASDSFANVIELIHTDTFDWHAFEQELLIASH
jgi:G3E family GTPase